MHCLALQAKLTVVIMLHEDDTRFSTSYIYNRKLAAVAVELIDSVIFTNNVLRC